MRTTPNKTYIVTHSLLTILNCCNGKNDDKGH